MHLRGKLDSDKEQNYLSHEMNSNTPAAQIEVSSKNQRGIAHD